SRVFDLHIVITHAPHRLGHPRTSLAGATQAPDIPGSQDMAMAYEYSIRPWPPTILCLCEEGASDRTATKAHRPPQPHPRHLILRRLLLSALELRRISRFWQLSHRLTDTGRLSATVTWTV